MTTGGRRDDAELARGLGRWLAAHPALVAGWVDESSGGGEGWVEITGLAHAEGGQANETLLVDLGPGGPAGHGLVVRLPPLAPTFPDYDLGPQAAVQNAVAGSGVPAPAPAFVENDRQWIGTPFLVMPRVHGDIAGPAPAFDAYVKDSGPAVQRLMHDGLIDAVVAVHGVPWEAAGLGDVLAGPTLPRRRGALERVRRVVVRRRPTPGAGAGAGLVPPPRAVRARGGAAVGRHAAGQPRVRRRAEGRVRPRLGPGLPRPAGDGSRMALRPGVHDAGVVRSAASPASRRGSRRWSATSGTAATRYATWPGTRCSRWCAALAINDRHQRIAEDPGRRDNPMGSILLARLEAAAKDR